MLLVLEILGLRAAQIARRKVARGDSRGNSRLVSITVRTRTPPVSTQVSFSSSSVFPANSARVLATLASNAANTS